MTPEQERRLGEAFMRNIRRSLDIVEDPEINEYVQSLGYRLVAQSDSYQRKFTFFVVNDPAINAFAGWGGFIGINTGLMLVAETESELASVLAHEIAHITQNHLPRAYKQASDLSLPATAALIAAMILGQHSGQLAEAALTSTLAGYQQSRINFTRANEEEADRIGIQILADAGFNPQAMPAFFERLQQSVRLNSTNLPEFLSTHPVTLARIADSRSRAEQSGKPSIPDESQFALMRAKSRVLTAASNQESLQYFAAALKNNQLKDKNALRYGYALSLAAGNNYAEAKKILDELLKQDPYRANYLTAKAQIALANRQYKDVLNVTEQALALYPNHYALTAMRAEALIQTNAGKSASLLLQRHLADTPLPEPQIYKLLARAEDQAGAPASASQYMAEYHYQMGQIRTAIEQLNTALNQTNEGDFYRVSRLKARLEQLEDEALLEGNKEEDQRSKEPRKALGY